MAGPGDEDEGMGWAAVAKVVGIVLLVGLLMAGLPYAAGFLARWGQVPVWPGVVGILLALGALYVGVKAYRERQLIRDTPTSKVGSLATGTVQVQGEAQPLTEPLVSPLTHTPACMYELKVKEEKVVKRREIHREGGRTRTKEKRRWRTVLTIRDEVPFCIDDGSGRIPVRADQAELVIKVEDHVEVDKRDPPPEALVAWAQDHDPFDPPELNLPGPLGEMLDEIQRREDPGEIDPSEFYPEGLDPESDDPGAVDPEDLKLAGILAKKVDAEEGAATDAEGSLLDGMGKTLTSGVETLVAHGRASGRRKHLTQSTRNKRTFEERVLGVGEDTYVFGSAQRLPEAEGIQGVEDLVLREDPRTGQFLVSDKSPGRLLGEKLVRSVASLDAAIVLLGYGTMALLLSAGLL